MFRCTLHVQSYSTERGNHRGYWCLSIYLWLTQRPFIGTVNYRPKCGDVLQMACCTGVALTGKTYCDSSLTPIPYLIALDRVYKAFCRLCFIVNSYYAKRKASVWCLSVRLTDCPRSVCTEAAHATQKLHCRMAKPACCWYWYCGAENLTSGQRRRFGPLLEGPHTSLW